MALGVNRSMLKPRQIPKLSRIFKTVFILLVALSFATQSTVGAMSKESFEAIRKQHAWYDADACGASGESTTNGTSPGPVFILGDSIGEGVTAPLGTALPSAEGWSVSGDSKVGRPLSEGIAIAKAPPTGLKSAKAVLVILGTNSLGSSSNPTDINTLIASIKGANSGATIFWLKINTTRSDLEAGEASFNTALGSASGITLIDNSTAIGGDGVHPANYTDLANTIGTSIKAAATSSAAGGVNMDGTATQLATQMLANPNITYWTNNGVNTKDVVTALSQGKKAYTTAANAPNKEADINTNILKFILEVAGSNKIMVNALTDKTHSNGSNHYKGLAVDLDKNESHTAPTSVLDPIAQKYGGKRNSETSHWHYDFTEAPEQDSSPSPATAGSCCPAGGAGAANAALSANIPQVWRDLIAQAAPNYPDVNPNLVAMTLWVENRGWPEYKDSGWPVSSVGAQGPWQFWPPTWASMGTDGDGDGVKDPDNPKDSVHAAFKHQLGSAGKPIAAEFDGDADSSFNKIIFQRDEKNLLSYAASYNGGAAPSGDHINTFPRSWPGGSRDDYERQNSGYIVMAYWLLATDFVKTANNDFTGFVDAYTGGATEGGGSPSSASEDGGCTSQTGGVVDGFPLITTKKAIKDGVEGAKWDFTKTTNYHHDYNAADIHVVGGTKVVAAKAGRVVLAQEDNGTCESNIAILGTDSNVYYYTHMMQGSLKASVGQDVTSGTELGQVGKDGCNFAPHLHFDMQPPPATNRPGCAGAACKVYTFIDVQPMLVQLYERLPE